MGRVKMSNRHRCNAWNPGEKLLHKALLDQTNGGQGPGREHVGTALT